MNKSQIKRINTLIDKGVYHAPHFVTKVCKQCGKEYKYDDAAKKISQYFTYGFCCNECYKNSGEKLINKCKTTLRNANIPFTDDNFSEVFSIYQSNRTKACVEKWRNTMKNKYGIDYASKRGKNGWERHKKTFLIDNGIVSEEEYSELSEERINEIFLEKFNSLTKHGENVINGRKAKYGNNYKKSYQEGFIKGVTNLMKKEYGDEIIEKLSDIDYQNAYNKCASVINSKKGRKNLLEWKKSTLIHHGCSKEYIMTCDEKEIERLYSEYLSKRMVNLIDSTKSGYKHTEKGWFYFKNWNKFFFRSSWEKHVCEILEKLNYLIEDVKVPEPIYYKLNGITHAYFCDFKIIYKNGNILHIEVKPERKKKEKINECKIKSAIEMWGKTFIVATENEIFSNNLYNILVNYGRNKIN